MALTITVDESGAFTIERSEPTRVRYIDHDEPVAPIADDIRALIQRVRHEGYATVDDAICASVAMADLESAHVEARRATWRIASDRAEATRKVSR